MRVILILGDIDGMGVMGVMGGIGAMRGIEKTSPMNILRPCLSDDSATVFTFSVLVLPSP